MHHKYEQNPLEIQQKQNVQRCSFASAARVGISGVCYMNQAGDGALFSVVSI